MQLVQKLNEIEASEPSEFLPYQVYQDEFLKAHSLNYDFMLKIDAGNPHEYRDCNHLKYGKFIV
jgi:hypothetical protein